MSMQKKNTFSNADQGSPMVERNALEVALFPSGKEEEGAENQTHTGRMQYRNIKFLL